MVTIVQFTTLTWYSYHFSDPPRFRGGWPRSTALVQSTQEVENHLTRARTRLSFNGRNQQYQDRGQVNHRRVTIMAPSLLPPDCSCASEAMSILKEVKPNPPTLTPESTRHEEYQYLDLIRNILQNGEHRPDRYPTTQNLIQRTPH